METVLRAAAIYVVLLSLLRLAGRRTLAEMTAFDLVLLLVISEATQQAMIGDDFSLTTALLVIVTLIGMDVGFSYLKQYFPKFEGVVDGRPMILVENGHCIPERLEMSRVDKDDILEAARSTRGLERIEQIRFAILEVNGGISIIPHQPITSDLENEGVPADG
jgi:uncharacterized membrane protein YcaP (DUF421 family)